MAINLKSVVAELDVRQLRNLANARRLEEKKVALLERESDLRKQLQSVSSRVLRLEKRITRIIGRQSAGSSARRNGRKSGRRRTGLAIPTLIVKALKGAGKKPLRAREVSDWIQKRHPQTSRMADFRSRVAQALARDRKRFQRVKKGLYALKPGIAA